MKQILWWFCLFVAPAVLIALELFHPAGFTTSPGMYQSCRTPSRPTSTLPSPISGRSGGSPCT